MESDNTRNDTPEPTADDLSAAEPVIARMDGPPAPDSPKYAALRHGIASMRAMMGPDRFALVYGLREPRDQMEELERALFQQGITPDEYAEAVKSHALRAIDADMLTAFCDGYEARLAAYADLLQTAVTIATDRRDAGTWRRLEPQADAAAARMDAKLNLFSDELGTVLRFLTELRAGTGEPVCCGGYTGDSAHWIAALAWSHASQAWKSCKETAHRSRTDPRSLYATTASSLFFQTWIEPGKLPAPNDLAALMRLERAAAERKLRDRAEPKSDAASRIRAPIVEIRADAENIGAAATKTGGGAASLDANWRDVQRRLLELYERGERYTSVSRLAKRLGRANATVQKAIKPPQSSLDRLDEEARAEARSAARKLAGWQARSARAKGAPRATSINDVVTDNAKQTREADPADEAEGADWEVEFARLIQDAQPDERAKLNAMEDEQRKELVAILREDPDNYDRVLGRKA